MWPPLYLLLGLRTSPFIKNNLVTVSGEGAPIVFSQTGVAGELWVNNQLGSSANTLQSDAMVQTANAAGAINLAFNLTAGGQAGWTIAGSAIAPVPGPGGLALLGAACLFARCRRRCQDLQ